MCKVEDIQELELLNTSSGDIIFLKWKKKFFSRKMCSSKFILIFKIDNVTLDPDPESESIIFFPIAEPIKK